MTTCLMPGSFDPFTIGHYRIAMAASQLFPLVVIGVAKNPNRHKSMFSVSTRVKVIEASVADINHGNIMVEPYDVATVSYCSENNIECIVRGCRNGSEFDSELTNKCINDSLSHKTIQTIILPADPTVSYVSSTLVRWCIDQNLEKWKSYVMKDAIPIIENALVVRQANKEFLQKMIMAGCNKT